VNLSTFDARLEKTPMGRHAVRLGFRTIKGFRTSSGETLMAARGPEGEDGFDSVRDLWLRTGLGKGPLEKLAHADAFRSIGLDRREALWAVRALGDEPLPLFRSAAALGAEEEVQLPKMRLGEHVAHDYARMKLSLKAHPLELLRGVYDREKHIRIEELKHAHNNSVVTLTGLVLLRQRPGTAKGVIFMTLEDETGSANIIVWAKTFEKYRKTVLGSKLLTVRGRVQREGIVIHVIVDHMEDRTTDMGLLSDDYGSAFGKRAQRAARAAKVLPGSRDFH